jgi:alpha-1,6-mannosyltransferase
MDITKYFGEETGGIRTYLLEKARYVEARRELRQVLVVPGAEDSLTEFDGVRWYRLRGPRIPTEQTYRFLLATRTTRRIIEHERPQLIEVGSPFLVPWVVRRANRQMRAPMVWFYHTHFPRILTPRSPLGSRFGRVAPAAAWAYVRRLGKLYRAVLVASETVARELEQHGIENIRRVSLGVDLERFHPARRGCSAETRRRFGLPSGPLVIFLGRFAREKQLDVVLRAWPEIAAHSDATLVLVGDGPARSRLKERYSTDRVVWLPYERDRDRAADLLSAADLYLAPGPAETFGLSALEAMASGVPVLSVDQGGVADRVTASGAGALYPMGDSGGLTEAALALLSDDLAHLGRMARQYAEQHHSWKSAFDGIFGVYREVLGGL